MRNGEKCMIYFIGDDTLLLTSEELFKILDRKAQIFYRKTSKKNEGYRKKSVISL